MRSIRLSGQALLEENSPLLVRIQSIVPALARRDPQIWGEEAAEEAAIRLGWIDLPTTSRALLPEIDSISAWARSRGLSHVVLCGMGGSSLAPEVITAAEGCDLTVLDTTDPDQIRAALSDRLAQSVIVIASKSGSTIETDSQRRIYESELRRIGLEPRDHLVIVTDPGSPLAEEAESLGYRRILADPNVGGRYSALSAFGLVPSALAGVDVSLLLDQAESAATELASDDSPAAHLAAAIAQQSTPYLSIASASDSLPGFGNWVEQLVAESTGKQGRGILPIVLPSFDSPGFRSEGVLSVAIGASAAEIDLTIDAPLGAQFLLWEWATALLGFAFEIDPFNQPNVTESKTNTARLLQEWGGSPPLMEPLYVEGAIEVHVQAGSSGRDLQAVLTDFLGRIAPGGYLGILAYLNREADAESVALRDLLAERTTAPVTFGWGPRYLHSTGQFHKGGPLVGSFLQITGEPEADLEVPGAPYSFATLNLAQALGDHDALSARGLPMLRLHLRDRRAGIGQLFEVIRSL
jgi:glucose-6-phosphate isomerase